MLKRQSPPTVLLTTPFTRAIKFHRIILNSVFYSGYLCSCRKDSFKSALASLTFTRLVKLYSLGYSFTFQICFPLLLTLHKVAFVLFFTYCIFCFFRVFFFLFYTPCNVVKKRIASVYSFTKATAVNLVLWLDFNYSNASINARIICRRV